MDISGTGQATAVGLGEHLNEHPDFIRTGYF
jgi:hypothetical protein